MRCGRLPFSTQNVNFPTFLDEILKIQFPREFSPLRVALIKKMLVVKPDERPSLIQLQGHPWLKGLDQLSPNIAPKPVFFQNSRSIVSFSKVKRRKTVPDPIVLKKCIEFGIDCEQLTIELEKGETTANTTTYFVLLNPVSERPPVVRPPPRRSESDPRITIEKPISPRNLGETLPVLTSPRPRRKNLTQRMHNQTASGPIHLPPWIGKGAPPPAPLVMSGRRTFEFGQKRRRP
jgi:serine/threonine protein kinase